MSPNFLSKSIIPAIGSTTSLIQIIIVIFFFENYLISFQETSLFKISFSLQKVYLTPFIWFFFFLALSKFIWFLIWVIISIFDYEYLDENENKIPITSSFSLFNLSILTFWYVIINPIKENKYLPIDYEKYFLATRFYFSLIVSVAFFSLIIFFLHPPETIITRGQKKLD